MAAEVFEYPRAGLVDALAIPRVAERAELIAERSPLEQSFRDSATRNVGSELGGRLATSGNSRALGESPGYPLARDLDSALKCIVVFRNFLALGFSI